MEFRVIKTNLLDSSVDSGWETAYLLSHCKVVGLIAKFEGENDLDWVELNELY